MLRRFEEETEGFLDSTVNRRIRDASLWIGVQISIKRLEAQRFATVQESDCKELRWKIMHIFFFIMIILLWHEPWYPTIQQWLRRTTSAKQRSEVESRSSISNGQKEEWLDSRSLQSNSSHYTIGAGKFERTECLREPEILFRWRCEHNCVGQI